MFMNFFRKQKNSSDLRIDQVAELQEAEWIPKLYIVTRGDLPPGAQACQAIHAVREFVRRHPEADQKWYTESNHVALLAVKNEQILYEYCEKAFKRNINYAMFHEPDFDNQLTAAVFDATLEAREMLQDEKSALKQNWYGGIKRT